VTDVSEDVGLRPPPPHSEQSGKEPQREFVPTIPGTAGSIDPLADFNEQLPKQKTRADFRPEEFDRALLQHGKRLRWRKAMLCPCINVDSDQASLDCTDCDGSGYFYVDPLEIQAHMASFEANTRLYEKFGLWVSGEVSVTTQAAYRLGWRDSLEMIDDLMNFNELIKKGDRRGRRSMLPANTDSGRYRIAQLTKALVKLGDQPITALEIGYHITLNEQGHIEWTAQGQALVPDDTLVSLHYDFHPVWIVISHPHAQRSDVNGFKRSPDEVIGLPLQAAAQLDYLAETERQLPVTGGC
jgi:hypothetical protein